MSAGAIEPALDAIVILGDGDADCAFGGGAIYVTRRAGDIPLAAQTFAQLVICSADMLTQYMAARSFVLGEIANRTSAGRFRFGGGVVRLGRFRRLRRRLAGDQDRADRNRKEPSME